jgi:hypothetical protein
MNPALIAGALESNRALQSLLRSQLDVIEASIQDIDARINESLVQAVEIKQPQKRARLTYFTDPVTGEVPPIGDCERARVAIRDKIRPYAEAEAQQAKKTKIADSAEFSADEDRRLVQAAFEFGGHDWSRIREASRLTLWSPFELFQHYQQCLNGSMLSQGPWTLEEDQLLKRAVEIFGTSKKSFPLVAAELEGRSASQCRERWDKSLDPSLKKGRWSSREERLLVLAVRAHGREFVEVFGF